MRKMVWVFYGVVFFLFWGMGPLESCSQTPAEIGSATLTLDVRDGILMALENNRGLAVEHYGPEINKTFVVEEQSTFDPEFTSEIAMTESQGQRTSGVGEFRGVTSHLRDLSVGISKQTPSGIGIGLETSVESRKSNVYSQLYSTRVGASLTVPLMEGSGSNVNLVGVRQAERDVELSQYELRGFVMALASQVEEYYWDLLSAREELRIRLASLDLAHAQLKETEDRIEVGEIPEIELAAAEGEVALREEAVIDARSAMDDNRLHLLQLINPPGLDFWGMAFDLIESPTDEEPLPGDVRDHITTALRNRPDLNQARVQLQKNDLEIVKTKNGLLPRLDFFITFGKTGYASSFNDSVTTLDEDNFDLNAGFQLQYSFGNRAKRARHQRAEYQSQEAQASLANFEQLVELDVRTSYVEWNRTLQQISATRAATRLQEAKYQAELEKFRVGKSTNLLVLVSQRDLIQSQLDELSAQINLRKALSKLHYAEGTLLDHHRIILPEKMDIPSSP